MLHEIRSLPLLSIDDVKTVLHLATDAIAQSEGILGFSPDEPFMSIDDVLNDVLYQFQLEIDEMTVGEIKDRATYLQRLKDDVQIIKHARHLVC